MQKLLGISLGVVVVSVLSTLCSSALHAAEDRQPWSYAGPGGPSHWAELDERFHSCTHGKFQSPIDIRTSEVRQTGLSPLVFDYAPTPATITNNGHTIQVSPANAGQAELDSIAYRLLQFHFHTPSEERVNGEAYPLVAHFVHENDKGELAVIALLFRIGQENVVLKPMFDELPLRSGELRQLPTLLELTALLPKDRAYFAYTGSLTTPPCSEGVKWYVLKTPVEISAAQLLAFRQLYQHNARPVQPLNGRVVRAG